MKSKDNALVPIIAIDFDDTINVGGSDTYPVCGHVRPWAKEVINFMHDLGIKVVIWTSRDVAYNQDEKKMYDHMSPMIDWLDENEIHYDAINKSIQFAPYAYNGRKIYAHMYVDDRSFGWDGAEDGNDEIMLKVLGSFLHKICGFSDVATSITVNACRQRKAPKKWMIDGVASWKSRDGLLQYAWCPPTMTSFKPIPVVYKDKNEVD